MTAARARLLVAAALLAYLLALVLWRDAVPPGLNNDAAEEALRGIELLEAGRFHVLSSSPGIPQETLYLYAVALLTRVLGTTTLSIHLLAWAVAVACVWLVAVAVRRADPRVPFWVPLAIAVSSIWLFHYGRSGVRAISAPLFALAVAVLLDRAEQRADRPGPALACGAVLGLSLYAYTACRVLVAAFSVHAAIRLWRGAAARPALRRCYALVLAAAAAVSLPMAAAALRDPTGVLLRGSYVVRGGWRTAVDHVMASALLPAYYFDRYRTLTTEGHIFDGVSAGLTAAGLNPVGGLLLLFLLFGLAAAWRRRQEPVVLYLLVLWPLTVLLLGFAGPSLTRLLIMLPSLLVVASLGAASLRRSGRFGTLLVAAALGAGVIASAYDYAHRFAGSAAAAAYFSPAATPIGQRARALAHAGQRVLCIVAKDANVVRYLTHDVAAEVDVVEFYRRPFDGRELSPVFRPDVVLVERTPALAGARTGSAVTAWDGFDEIRPSSPAGRRAH